MGPYCNYCNRRCFVPFPPGTPQEAIDAYQPHVDIIATCQAGQQFERNKTGGWSYSRIVAAIAEREVATATLEVPAQPEQPPQAEPEPPHAGETLMRVLDLLTEAHGLSCEAMKQRGAPSGMLHFTFALVNARDAAAEMVECARTGRRPGWLERMLAAAAEGQVRS